MTFIPPGSERYDRSSSQELAASGRITCYLDPGGHEADVEVANRSSPALRRRSEKHLAANRYSRRQSIFVIKIDHSIADR